MPTFLLEIGTEELPADFLDSAIAQWKQAIPKTLSEQYLSPSRFEVYGTPRRLAVIIEGLPDKQADREEEIKGPPVKAAFKNGEPTKAAEGFARKQGVNLEDFQIRETNKGDFIFVQKTIVGREIKDILTELTPQWVNGLEGRRFMRWGDGDLRFPRPIRWLVALLDDTVLPLEWVNGSTTLNSDRISYGHRILSPDPISLPTASDYLSLLKSGSVIVDQSERKEMIEAQIEDIEAKEKGKADIFPDLLSEVINLVEYPTAIVGKFDQSFLSLPPEVTTTVMVKHQRYFPLRNEQKELLANFITISNGDPNKAEIIAAGNERVVRARLADGQFFYKADCDEHLDSYLPQLETVTFQEELGTMRDKVDRIMEIASQIAEQLDLDDQNRSDIESTAMLCKADLVTQMVYEFPELQGVMGQKYALVSGESPQVAQGIFEHYLPRTADDMLPDSLTGQVVGIADRIDTLVSIFGLGMIPTGSSDPFALRRAANAIISISWNSQLGINLKQLLAQASQDFVTAHPEKESPFDALSQFFIQRLQTLLQEELKIDYDLVNAVLGENDPIYTKRALEDILDVQDRAQFLQKIRQNGQLEQIYATVNRSARLSVKGDLDLEILDPAGLIKAYLWEKSSEKAFYEGLVQLLPQTEAAQGERNYQLLVEGLSAIAPTVSQFFDGEDSVLVMAEDEQVKENRLNLLGLLRNHARVLADFGAIVM
ncbi:MAG: glycine--tRNA ligase subunit beta [Microcystaceae cyanobacterium]